MKNQIIDSSDIQNLITKFYYKNNHLCFQILLYFGLDKTVPYQEFTDYAEYKKVYNQLMTQKNNGSLIEVPQLHQETTNMNFA